MQRRALLLLAASGILAATASRGEDGPDEGALAERARLASARSTLVELEARRSQEGADAELTALHSVAFANQTDPRLSGHVVRLGGEGEPANLRAALPHILPGDTVLVRPGRDILDLSFRAPRRAPIATTSVDLAIVGSGAGRTTLVVLARQGQPIQRLRIEHCTLDLFARPVEVTGSWLHIRDCELTNFKGAAFHGDDAVILLEDCTIDGRGLNDSRVFDLGGRSLVLVRRTRFVDVGSLTATSLDYPCAFDDCTARGWVKQAYGGPARPFVKATTGMFAKDAAVRDFERATDDEAVIAAAAGEKVALDERSARLVDRLGLARSLPYWIALVRDARPKVRALAAARLKKLARVEVGATVAEGLSDADVEAAVKDLDAEAWTRRDEATRRLEAAGDRARPGLLAAARAGTPEQKERSRALLGMLRDRAIVGDDVEHGRLLRWFERERDRLSWVADRGRWEGAPE